MMEISEFNKAQDLMTQVTKAKRDVEIMTEVREQDGKNHIAFHNTCREMKQGSVNWFKVEFSGFKDDEYDVLFNTLLKIRQDKLTLLEEEFERL